MYNYFRNNSKPQNTQDVKKRAENAKRDRNALLLLAIFWGMLLFPLLGYKILLIFGVSSILFWIIKKYRRVIAKFVEKAFYLTIASTFFLVYGSLATLILGGVIAVVLIILGFPPEFVPVIVAAIFLISLFYAKNQ